MTSQAQTPRPLGIDRDPDLKLGGLSVWVLRREFPDAEDYWDGNWLDVFARVEAPGASVEASGPWLRNTEVGGFLDQLETVYRDLSGTAKLDCSEPYLGAEVTCDALGHVEITVSITPDHLTQSHRFTFELDQTFLQETIRGCKGVLERFPIRGK